MPTTTDGLEEAEADGGTTKVGEGADGEVVPGGGTEPSSPTDIRGDEETAADDTPSDDLVSGDDRADDGAAGDGAGPASGREADAEAEAGGGPQTGQPLAVDTSAAAASSADAVNKAFSPDARAAEAGSYKERRQRELDELRKQKLAQKLREGLSNAMLELSQEDEQTRIELLRARQAELEELRGQKLTQSRSTDLSQAASESELAAEEERIRIELLQLEAAQRAAHAQAEAEKARAKEEKLERERLLIEDEMKQKAEEEERERTEGDAAELGENKEDKVREGDESQTGAASTSVAEGECPEEQRSGSDDSDDGDDEADAEVEASGGEVLQSATEERCITEKDPEAHSEESVSEAEAEAEANDGSLSEDQLGLETKPPGDDPEPELEPEPSEELMEKSEAEPLREVAMSQEECVASSRNEEGDEDAFAAASDEIEVAEVATALKSLSLEDGDDASPGGQGQDTPAAKPARGDDADNADQVTAASVQSSTEGDAIVDDQPAESVNTEEGKEGAEEACKDVETDVVDVGEEVAEDNDTLDDADAAEATTRCQLAETGQDDAAAVDKAGIALEATTATHGEKEASGPSSSVDQKASKEDHPGALTEDHVDTRLNSEEQQAHDIGKSGPESDQNALIANGERECSKETPMLQAREVQAKGMGSIEETAVTLTHSEDACVDAEEVSEAEKGKKWKSAVPEYVKFRTSNASAGFDRAYYAS